MGLIDLKTDLKSLKYGSDSSGGGTSNYLQRWSKQDWVKNPIPKNPPQDRNNSNNRNNNLVFPYYN